MLTTSQQVEQAEKSLALVLSQEQERQRASEMREEFARLNSSVRSVTEKVTSNQSQIKEIGEKIENMVG